MHSKTHSETTRFAPYSRAPLSLDSSYCCIGIQTEKAQLIHALQTHQINTLQELRRIEKVFAEVGTPDVTGPMTSAWSHYVNSNMLLTELRALTTNYPFSSHVIDEAKRRVYADPLSNRSWNFCWLVLSKVQSDRLIPYYAIHQAQQPEMWGDMAPTQHSVQQLANAFTQEWTWAISEMLRHWERSPVGRP
ncbi:hypothetical protein BT63DRAFT_433009 [Microthyrium microscopicum]|uniref:Uncharacterized protein n=1 Tax=Microthyrium microscopicum TaxID=703497 RepID=A0A6A6UB77_9PEZI|nr:hypothetical protein BT63DRAFT_433009 [Microthyrium microscopicum]